jgi:RsiW-degrading membrane proteinase PrsW (M82 family)
VGSDPHLLLRSLAPYLARPAVIYIALVYIAGIVPLIEEVLKPLGVWLLVGRALSPAAGFAAGALSGAGYALFESLALAAGGGEEWAFQAFVRSGTGLVHIATAGLTGYALALAWRENRYIRLGVAYLLSVTLHSLWNGLTVIYSYSALLEQTGSAEAMPLVTRIGIAAPFAITYLALTCFVFLLLANRLLRRPDPLAETPAYTGS